MTRPDFLIDLCEALGLNPADVLSIECRQMLGDKVTIDVRIVMPGSELANIMNRHKSVPREKVGGA